MRDQTGTTGAEWLAAEVARLNEAIAAEKRCRERAEADNEAAQALLDELLDESTGALQARVEKLQQQITDLQRAVAAKERQQQTAQNVTQQLQATTEQARIAQQAAAEALKLAQRQQRAAETAQVAAANELARVEDELAVRTAELARYTTSELISCGCTLHVQKGPGCNPGALITVLTPCGMLDDTQNPANHVIERT